MSRSNVRRKKQQKFLTYRWLDGLLRKSIGQVTEAHENGEKASVADFARIVHFHRNQYGVCLPEVVIHWVESLPPDCDYGTEVAGTF